MGPPREYIDFKFRDRALSYCSGHHDENIDHRKLYGVNVIEPP